MKRFIIKTPNDVTETFGTDIKDAADSWVKRGDFGNCRSIKIKAKSPLAFFFKTVDISEQVEQYNRQKIKEEEERLIKKKEFLKEVISTKKFTQASMSSLSKFLFRRDIDLLKENFANVVKSSSPVFLRSATLSESFSKSIREKFYDINTDSGENPFIFLRFESSAGNLDIGKFEVDTISNSIKFFIFKDKELVLHKKRPMVII